MQTRATMTHHRRALHRRIQLTGKGRHSLLTAVLLFASTSFLFAGSIPPWWAARGLLNGSDARDYAEASQGQLKNFAKAARDEFAVKLPIGAGTVINSMVDTWMNNKTNARDYAPVNLGQLKSVAKPFYDRLIAAGYTVQYPWSGTANDYAAANLGQLKNVFCFILDLSPSVDSDMDGLPDAWQIAHFGTDYASPAKRNRSRGIDDWDGDGISNVDEYALNLDPALDDSSLAGTSVAYSYDNTNRLTGASVVSVAAFSYDGEGNISSAAQSQ